MLTSLLSGCSFNIAHFYVDQSKNSFKIGSFEIAYYAVAIMLGMILCVLAAIPLIKKIGQKPDFLMDLLIGIIPCAIIGARLWYVLFDIQNFHSFKEVINIREGGLAIYGGVAGGALGIFLVCLVHRKRKIKVLSLFDVGSVMLPLGQAVGRWGNFFNQEVYGAVDPNRTGLPISTFIQSTGNYHYALFLWESVLNVILFALLYWFFFKYKGKRNGYAMGLYFIGYGLIRFIMEPLRDSEFNLPLFGLSSLGMVWVSVAVILAGLAVIAVLFYKDFKDCNKSFKEYFAMMFGPGRKAAQAVADVQPAEDEARRSVPVKRIKPVSSNDDGEKTEKKE